MYNKTNVESRFCVHTRYVHPTGNSRVWFNMKKAVRYSFLENIPSPEGRGLGRG